MSGSSVGRSFEPSTPRSFTSTQNALPTSTSKPKFWQIFNRRKTNVDHDQSRPGTAIPQTPTSSLFKLPITAETRPTLTFRSRSENLVTPKTKSTIKQQRRRRQSPVLTDPPPLVQAYSQAIIHSILEIPCSPRERGQIGTASTPSKELQSFSVRDVKLKDKAVHQRNSSNSSVCSLKEKLMFLTVSGHVLQYESEGNGDRLPEKILELNREAVAFASDAIQGRPWVLQISSRASTADSSQPLPIKQNRSMLNLRPSENRRSTETFYLVFDDPEDLYSWLFSVRKEIENLGGMEYRPDTRSGTSNSERSPFSGLRQQTKTPPALRRISRSSSALPLHLPGRTDPEILQPKLPPPPMERSVSSQSTTTSSSIISSTVDKRRDSIFSDSPSSTVGTSFDSISLASPIQETFITQTSSDQSCNATPSKNITHHDALSTRMENSNAARPTIQERRQASGTNHSAPRVPCKETGNQSKDLPQPPDLIPESKPDRPISVIAPLPDNGCLPKSSLSGSHRYSMDETRVPLDMLSDRARLGQQRESRGRSSMEISTESTRPKYSLFPSPMPAQPLEPAKSQNTLREDTDVKQNTYRKGRSRTLTLNLSKSVFPPRASPSVEDFSLLPRSPAVTDAILAANFGAGPMSSPSSPCRVPNFSDLHISNNVANTSVNMTEATPTKQNHRRLSSAKSMPSIDQEISTAYPRIPLGPPPTGPLPAVPVDNIHSPPSSYRGSNGTTPGKNAMRSPKSAVHSRNPSYVHSRNPSYIQTSSPKHAHDRSRNTSDGSATSVYSNPSSIKKHSRNVSRTDAIPVYPPRTSSTKHNRNRSGSGAVAKPGHGHAGRMTSHGSNFATAT